MVDNTAATPYLVRPFDHGADIIVHSATKYIGGHGTSIGGVIVDGGSFDWGESGKFPNMTEPDPSYHGLPYWPALGHGAYIIKARVQMLRDLGSATTPFNSFLFLQGLETLSLRMERHCSNAQVVADYLDAHDQVERVHFAGLASSAWHDRATELTGGRGYGAIPAFDIKGGLEAGKKFVEGLEMHSHVANIGDAPEPRHPPGVHYAQPAHRGRTGDHGCVPGPGAALGGHREHRRHHRRPRQGIRSSRGLIAQRRISLGPRCNQWVFAAWVPRCRAGAGHGCLC